MIDHENQMMEVMVDGVKQWRRIDHYDSSDVHFLQEKRPHGMMQAVPVHAEHEWPVWDVGSDIPRIVKCKPLTYSGYEEWANANLHHPEQ
jgi:hypothetical protein